mgnify:FL=1
MKHPDDSAWEAAVEVLRRLHAHGHQAVLAGGCVRDMLLGAVPKDYDVATDAAPHQVLQVFPRAKKVGAKFGVVLVRRHGHEIEVATFRTDGTYSDGRRPDEVVFGTAQDDAHRRDFTMNGLFYDPLLGQIVDYVDGRRDLDAKILRTIGDPDERFREDHLRMLRAVRLAARLGFSIEQGTAEAIRRQAHFLPSISVERIWMELEQILSAPSRGSAWRLMHEFGLDVNLAASWTSHPELDSAARDRLAALPGVPLEPRLPLAALIGSRGVAAVADICRDLRLSNRISENVGWLTTALPTVQRRDLSLADFKRLLAGPAWQDLCELLRADLEVSGRGLAAYDSACARAAGIAPDAVAPPPLVTGDDLFALGLTPGPLFGELLDAVYDAQLEESVATKAGALALVRQLLTRQGPSG